MWAFATSRVHGLGLTSEEFWASTPCEFAAHVAVFERSREFSISLNAALRAALCNGPLIRDDKKMWTPDMFMPGYDPTEAKAGRSDDSWRRSKEKVMGVVEALNRPRPTPEQKRELDNAAMKFTERQMRAAVARANGASSAEVVRIMEEQ